MLSGRFLASLCLCAWCSAHLAHADLLVETASAWDGQYGVGNLVPGKVWGQTFTAPTGADGLAKASFWLQAFPVDDSNSGPYDFDVTAYLMSWDGQMAAQPILADSVTSVTALPWEMTRLDFDFHGIHVTPNAQYVSFFVVSPSPAIDYLIAGYLNSNAYSGGAFGGPYAGSFLNLSNRAWSMTSGDLAFELSFSVPEPSTAVLGLLALIAGLACRGVGRRPRD